MDIKITYPAVTKKKLQRRKFLKIIRWPMIVAAIACPVVNIAVGGKAWSVIALMGMYMAWKLLLSPDLVEYNRLSQFIKLLTCSCLLQTLIEILIIPGWALTVVPIVTFGGLTVSGILFFTDMERQKQNMQPLLFLTILSLIASPVGLSIWSWEGNWALAAMGGTALLLLLSCAIVLGGDFLRELKRRFHIK